MSSRGIGGWLSRLRQPSTWATFLVLVVVGGLWLWSEADSPATAPSPSAQATPATTHTPQVSAQPKPSAGPKPSAKPSAPVRATPTTAVTDPESGLRCISATALPGEGQETLIAIDQGGPFVRAKDGSTFGNYEGVLPSRQRGYYREYTVPTPGISHAGARRIVTGERGEYYWTEDHYESFERIRR